MLAFNDLIINNGTLSHCMLFSIDLWNRVLEVSLLNQRTNRYITLLDVAKVPFTGVGGSAFPICPVWGYRPFLQARLTRLYLAKEFCKDFEMWVTVLYLISFALLLDVCVVLWSCFCNCSDELQGEASSCGIRSPLGSSWLVFPSDSIESNKIEDVTLLFPKDTVPLGECCTRSHKYQAMTLCFLMVYMHTYRCVLFVLWALVV